MSPEFVSFFDVTLICMPFTNVSFGGGAYSINFFCISTAKWRERSDSMVECLTGDQEAAGSSLTGVTALWSLSKTHLS